MLPDICDDRSSRGSVFGDHCMPRATMITVPVGSPCTNDKVDTPNGPGVCQGYTLGDDGSLHIMVRHPKDAKVDEDKCSDVISLFATLGPYVCYQFATAEEMEQWNTKSTKAS